MATPHIDDRGALVMDFEDGEPLVVGHIFKTPEGNELVMSYDALGTTYAAQDLRLLAQVLDESNNVRQGLWARIREAL